MQSKLTKDLPQNTKELVWLLCRAKFINIFCITILAFGIGVSMLSPSYLYIYLSNILLQFEMKTAILIAFVFIFLIILISITVFIKKRIQDRLVLNIADKITASLWYYIMQQPLDFFKSISTGNLSNKMYNYRDAIENNGKEILELLSLIILYLIFILFISYHNIYVAISFFLITTVLLFLTIIFAKKYNITQNNYIKAISYFSESVFDTVMGMQKIISSAAEANFNKRLLHLIKNKNNYLEKLLYFISYNNIFFIAIQSLIMLIIYCVIIISDKNQSIVFETIMVILLSSQLITIIISILEKVKTVSLINSKLNFISTLTINQLAQKNQKINLSGNITIQDLSFKYKNSNNKVLNNVNLSINSGEIIGLIGASGSGKSTLIRNIIGFEKPTTGTVVFDSIPINEHNQQMIRQNIGIVLQNQRIISGSIREVISNDKKISDEELIEILKLADFHSDLIKLPNGLNTKLKETGKGLSGGQKQKLLIASALVKSPKILLLDEATSSIDNSSQSRIISNLKNLKITTIIIAHRIQALKVVDSLYSIKSGDLKKIEKLTQN